MNDDTDKHPAGPRLPGPGGDAGEGTAATPAPQPGADADEGASGPDPARPASDPWPVADDPLTHPGAEQPVDVSPEARSASDGQTDDGPLPEPDDGPLPEPDQTGEIAAPATSPTYAYAHSRRPRTRPMDASSGDDFAPLDEPLYSESSLGSVVKPQVSKSSPSRNRTGRTIMLVSLVIVLLLVISGLSVELFGRYRAQNAASCIEQSLESITGTPVHVEMSGPFIGPFFTGKVAWIKAETEKPVADGAMELTARAEDVSTDGGSIGSLSGKGFLPYSRAEELALKQSSTMVAMYEGRATSITGNESAGTIDVGVNVTGPLLDLNLTIHLIPTTTSGKIVLGVEDISGLGLVGALVEPFVQDVVDSVAAGLFGPLFTQVAVNDFKVGDDGITFAFSGQSVDVAQMTSTVEGDFSCS